MARVKVMRSYDYCHFEVCLSSDEEVSLQEINNLRKKAQCLADEAVRQYQLAKRKAELRCHLENEKAQLEREIQEITKKCPVDWKAEEKAKVKALEDHEYWSQYDYNYDDPDEPCF